MICRILLVFILATCVCGSLVVNVSQTFYQAEENDNITLEWSFTTKTNSSPNLLSIDCNLVTNHELSVLYHVQNGVEVSEFQDKRFAGRVQSDGDALREGRITLRLSRLGTRDSGLYVCNVNTDYSYGSDSCQLSVIAAGDWIEPETSHTGRVGIFVGIALMGTMVVALFCFLFIRSLTNKEDFNSESSNEADKTANGLDESLEIL